MATRDNPESVAGKRDLRDLDREAFAAEPRLSTALPSFRIRQIYEWVARGVSDFESMSNLPRTLRAELARHYLLANYTIVHEQTSRDGTIKVLGRLVDGSLVESVLMSYEHGYSACISTQVGCKMGCTFCATAVGGFRRNLTAGEMCGQILELAKRTPSDVGRIDHVVLMGSGEPMDNLDQVIRFVKKATDPKYLGISGRSITVSTCGLVPEIRRLADEKFQLTLAISLHNPFDDDRKEIMPIARKYSIDEVLEAAKYYFDVTGRRVTYEYALIDGVNDSQRHAEALGERIRGQNAHINLIPVNPVKHRDYRSSLASNVKRFRSILNDRYGIPTTVRRELGSDIDAACGQLKANYVEEKENDPI